MSSRQIRLPNGRALGMTGLGDPDARRIVVLCHPSPGASGFDPDPAITRHRGVHVISVERPGYGASDPWPAEDQPSFAQYADDLARYLSSAERNARAVDGVDFGPIGLVGWGAGGLTALAMAGRHPRLVDRVVLVDTPAPRHFPLREPPGPPFALGSLGIADADPIASGAVRRRLERMLETAAVQRDAGVRGDQGAFGERDWLSQVGRIEADLLLVYGDAHPLVSADIDGRWFRKRVRDARLVRVENGAGLSIVTHWASILAHVAPAHADVGRAR